MTIETVPFNFDEIYTAVAAKFVAKGYDVQEGSNTMQLVTAMSYLTSMLNANTAVNINETLLSLARKRDTVLQDARILGYEVAHIQSYQYNLSLTFTNSTTSPVTHRVEKYTAFTSGTKTYYYVGPGFDVVLAGATGNPLIPVTSTITLLVKEGILKKFANEPTLTLAIQTITTTINAITTTTAQHYVSVPFTNVEENGIDMFITSYDTLGDLQVQEWFRSKQFLIDNDTILNKEFVRLDDIDTKMPRLYFKLGDVGKEVRVGSIVQMNVLVSSGTSGEMLLNPTTTLPSCVVNSFTVAIQGTNEESIESIKNNAPLFNNSANRLITKPDYIAFATRQAAVKYTDVWDGDFEYPARAGYIWFSFVPETLVRTLVNLNALSTRWDLQNPYSFINWYLEPGEITAVFANLGLYKIPTMQFLHRHPVYMDMEYSVKVARYNVNLSKAEVNSAIFKIIDDYYRDGDLLTTDSDSMAAETYNFEYFQSNLIKRIDRNLSDVTGIDLTLSASIPLTSQNINTEKFATTISTIDYYFNSVIFHLGIPFDGVFNPDASIILARLPSIDTLNIKGDQTMYTDFTTVVFTNGVRKYNIKLTTQGALGVKNLGTDIIVGEYTVINNLNVGIQITLFVVTPNAYTVGFLPSDFNLDYTDAPTNTIINNITSGLKISVKYPTPNIPFTRNTIARLRTVEFI